MKFGKLPNVDHIDFALPTEPATNRDILEKAPNRENVPVFYIGCTGWSMKEWLGKVYPKGTKAKDFLKEYTKQFNTIELNATHYRIPDEKTIRKWREESEDDFRFCPKLPQSISHSKGLGIGTTPLKMFCESIRGLEEKLGCCFMQLPPYFGFDRIKLLETFVEHFPNDIALAIEVRHESWFDQKDHTDQLFELLEKNNTSAVITDVAGRRDVLHMRLTTPTGMVRFVGNGLHPTDFERIDEWVRRIGRWFDQGLSEIYFFPHEPDNILAPDLAAYLLEKTKEMSNIASRGPDLNPEANNNPQMSLF